MRYLVLVFVLMASGIYAAEPPILVTEDNTQFDGYTGRNGKLYTRDGLRPILAVGKQRIILVSRAKMLLSTDGRYARVIQKDGIDVIKVYRAENNEFEYIKYDPNIEINLDHRSPNPAANVANVDNMTGIPTGKPMLISDDNTTSFDYIAVRNNKLFTIDNSPVLAVGRPRVITIQKKKAVLFIDGQFTYMVHIGGIDFVRVNKDGKDDLVKYDPNVEMNFSAPPTQSQQPTITKQMATVPQLQEEVPENKEIIGKAYIKTDPSGAELTEKDVKLGKTPCLVDLHVGKHTIMAKLENYQDKELIVIIKDVNIHKPDVFKLPKVMLNIDVICDKEWAIFVDDEPYMQNGQQVNAPATIKVSPGKHILKLRDENQKTLIKEFNASDKTIDMNNNAKAGFDKRAEVKPNEQKQKTEYRGKFYTLINDYGVFYVNAKKVYQTINQKAGMSPDITLRDGDVVVINLVNTSGLRNCVFSFVLSDSESMTINNLKDISAIKLNELTIDKINGAPISSLEKVNQFWNTNHIDSTNMSEMKYHTAYRGWGAEDNTWLCFIVGRK